MATPYLGEIKMMGCTFAPRGYAACNGQILSIAQNAALFSILGTNFGGNGTSNFGLPNLQGRTPMHPGNGHVLGEIDGTENVTVLTTQMPSHTHTANAVAEGGNQYGPVGNSWSADVSGLPFYAPAGSFVSMNPAAITNSGGNNPHTNLQPSLVILFIIAMTGVFPSRN